MDDITVDDLIQGVAQRQSAATMRAVGSLDQDPDAAAESMRLSQTTGVPASAINDNLEGFKEQYKAGLAANFVRNNPMISEYVNSHPLAAQVSSDDWGNLDRLSQGATKTSGMLNALLAAPRALNKTIDATTGAF